MKRLATRDAWRPLAFVATVTVVLSGILYLVAAFIVGSFHLGNLGGSCGAWGW